MTPMAGKGFAGAWLGKVAAEFTASRGSVIVDEYLASDHFNPPGNVEVLTGQADFPV